MGCFNAICAITGLPIFDGDNVKIAIIGESNKQNKYSRENDGSRFRFFVLPISGKYNEYGSIDFDKISENDKITLDINMALLKPGLIKDWGFEKYRNQEIEDLSSSQLFKFIAEQDLIYFPSEACKKLPEYKEFEENRPIHGMFFRKDEYPNTGGGNYLNVWFCHEFAWNHVQSLTHSEFDFSIYENELIAALYSFDEIDIYFVSRYNCKIRDFYSKEGILDEETRKKAGWRKYTFDTNNNQTSYIDSDGYWTKREFDERNNCISYENSTGYYFKRTYNANNNVLETKGGYK